MHHFFHVMHVTFGVVFGMFTHGACLYFVSFDEMFFAVVLASSVGGHYIYTQEKIL
jgi:hypothetical protein